MRIDAVRPSPTTFTYAKPRARASNGRASAFRANTRYCRTVLAALIAGFTLGAPSLAEPGAPLSAIDWLSDSVALPREGRTTPPMGRDDIATNALPGTVTVRPLDAPPPETLGLYPAQEAGLPETLWQASTLEDLSARLVPDQPLTLPAAQELLRQLVEVGATPPRKGAAQDFFLLRVDTLLAMGAVEPARALLGQADRDAPAAFRRWFDMALLTGRENLACQRMRSLPDITPTYPARIFCLARGGDWMAASLTLETAEALDVVTSDETARLARFLDDFAANEALRPPANPTPLDAALFEAFGEPLPTASLPLAFSHMDLRRNTGWKARIEAAQRLARAGALPDDRLWAVWTERAPAASGGLWDVLQAVQDLDAAMAGGDADAISRALPPAWEAMHGAGLAHLLARHHGEALRDLDLVGAAVGIGLRMRLLAGNAPPVGESADRDDLFLLALARGAPDDAEAHSDLARAVADGFASASVPDRSRRLIDEGRVGEALLLAVDWLEDGAAGNLDAVPDGLATLRAAGLEQRAIAAGLELLILEHRS